MSPMLHAASHPAIPTAFMSAPFLPEGRPFTADTDTALDTADLLIAPAVTYHQHRACNTLVRRLYASRGYKVMPPQQKVDDPNHVTFGAWLEGDLIATLTASRDSRAGLLADNLYGQEMAALRKPARVIGEVTRLAAATAFHNIDLLKTLFRTTYQYARTVFGVTDVVIEVNPRHAGYYRQKLGFSQAGALRTCPRVEAPAILLHRTLGNFRV